jgi:hypothetical protein
MTMPKFTDQQIAGPWTQFWDMHSGGGQKHTHAKIYIQAPEAEAKVIFYNRFGTNPDRVSCTCCGEDYSIKQSANLLDATAYHRGDGEFMKRLGRKVQTLEEYFGDMAPSKSRESSLAIFAEEIRPEERTGELPEQGYVWRD